MKDQITKAVKAIDNRIEVLFGEYEEGRNTIQYAEVRIPYAAHTEGYLSFTQGYAGDKYQSVGFCISTLVGWSKQKAHYLDMSEDEQIADFASQLGMTVEEFKAELQA